jgi:hypothetical protein
VRPSALAGARGLIGATGRMAPKPDLNRLIAGNDGAPPAPVRRAA